jgi:hypothetical protein
LKRIRKEKKLIIVIKKNDLDSWIGDVEWKEWVKREIVEEMK